MTLGDAEFENGRTRGWARAIGERVADAEAFAGLLLSTFVFLVGIGIVGGCMLALEWSGGRGSMHLTWLQKGGIGAVYAVFLVFEVRSLGWITRGLQQRRSPRAVWLALSQRDRGQVMNSIVAGWWIVHMAAILAVGAGLDGLLASALRGRTETIVGQSMGVVIVFTAAYMTSSFLVLAIGAWRGDEALLRRVWRFRGLIDVSLALGVLAVMRWF